MAIYAAEFSRANYHFKPPLQEKVTVILETETPFGDESLCDFESELWDALFSQYPLWQCPYNAGNPPPTVFENVRHGWSSPFCEDIRKL